MIKPSTFTPSLVIASLGRIRLRGFFQRYEHFRPYRDRILQWLAFRSDIKAEGPQDAVVVHVRRTDYIRFGWALPFSLL